MVSQLVALVHSAGTKFVIYVTGGGSQAIGALLAVPGASATLLEAAVPYSEASLSELLGGPVPSAASPDVAAQLARCAYRRAAALSEPGTPIVGVACTAALATGRPRQGRHRAHVAWHSGGATGAVDATLDKGARSRADEEHFVSGIVVAAVAQACGVPGPELERCGYRGDLTAAPGQLPGDALASHTGRSEDPVDALLSGAVRCVEFSGPAHARQVIVDAPRTHIALLPGSFNPLHEGHMRLLAAAAEDHGVPGAYELCVGNPDKGMLEKATLAQREEAFATRGLPLMITTAALYVEKARLFRNTVFVLGHDTARRIVMPKYYASETRMALDFATLAGAGCTFAVAGRLDKDDGRFKTMADVKVPKVLSELALFSDIPETRFRVDLSSTDIRQGCGAEQ